MTADAKKGKAGVRSRERSIKFIRIGIIAGLVGGLGFGMVMLATDMLPMVGMLIRQNNATIGFVVHMLISAFFGSIFGAVMGAMTEQRPIATLLIGAGYGLFWWVLGGLILMPLLLGMPESILVIQQMQMYSLVGHIIYGVAVGAVINLVAT